MQEKVIKILKERAKAKHVKITNRGNTAIFIAMAIVKKMNENPSIIIPDQGGWISFRTYPEMLNLEVKEVKTDKGVIDLDHLKKLTKKSSAFIFTSYAGYYAEQPIEKIAKICKDNKCLLIEDASGAIGDHRYCNAEYADIVLGSFGRWKPVNLGYGGFIATNKQELFNNSKEAFSLVKIAPQFYEDIHPFIETRERYESILNLSTKIKEELKDYEIFHKELTGPNVITEYHEDIIKYCEEKEYPYVLCPNYIRVNEKAISIEVKRLEF